MQVSAGAFLPSLRDWFLIGWADRALTRWANLCRRYAATVVVAIAGSHGRRWALASLGTDEASVPP